jgi:hypothetical protein
MSTNMKLLLTGVPQVSGPFCSILEMTASLEWLKK